ncbi:MAG: hypothetical protein ABI538_02480 [Pseudoxanthomonas sp.]
MQFVLETRGPAPDADAIARAIDAVDPAAIVDVDPSSGSLRISAAISQVELATIIDRAGYPLVQGQLEQLPSQCCGGCGG